MQFTANFEKNCRIVKVVSFEKQKATYNDRGYPIAKLVFMPE